MWLLFRSGDLKGVRELVDELFRIGNEWLDVEILDIYFNIYSGNWDILVGIIEV